MRSYTAPYNPYVFPVFSVFQGMGKTGFYVVFNPSFVFPVFPCFSLFFLVFPKVLEKLLSVFLFFPPFKGKTGKVTSRGVKHD